MRCVICSAPSDEPFCSAAHRTELADRVRRRLKENVEQKRAREKAIWRQRREKQGQEQ